eukprot:3767442-Amphidinium_carterae.1
MSVPGIAAICREQQLISSGRLLRDKDASHNMHYAGCCACWHPFVWVCDVYMRRTSTFARSRLRRWSVMIRQVTGHRHTTLRKEH